MMTAGEDVERQKFALRELFRSYNNADPDTVKAHVARLVKRLDWARGMSVGEGTEMILDESEVQQDVEVRQIHPRHEHSLLSDVTVHVSIQSNVDDTGRDTLMCQALHSRNGLFARTEGSLAGDHQRMRFGRGGGGELLLLVAPRESVGTVSRRQRQ